MTTPEDKAVQHQRFQMLFHPEDYDLSLAQQAVLCERYNEENWQDSEAEEFYGNIISEMEDHPGEFVANISLYEHGKSFNALLPNTDKNALGLNGNRVGAVGLDHYELADISDKVPRWKHFPHGFEIFLFKADRSHIPIDVSYRDPQIELSNIRNNISRGQVELLESKLVIGNDNIANHITESINNESLTREQAIAIQCGFLLLSEGLDIKVPHVIGLGTEMSELESTWEATTKQLRKVITTDRKHIAKIKALGSEIEVERLELAPDEDEVANRRSTPPFRIQESRTWPFDEVGENQAVIGRFNHAEKLLIDELKEIENSQLPMARLYLAAIRRYTSSIG